MGETALLVLLLAVSLSGAAQPQDDTAIDVPAFVETVTRLAASVERATPQDVTSVLVSVPSRVRVRSGSQQFDVPFESIAQRLAEARSDPSRWPERRREIHAQLLMIKTEAEALLNASPPQRAADLQTTLRAILARREFTRYNASSWASRLRRRINDWLRSFFSGLEGRVVDTRRIALVLAWVVTIAALSALVFWMYRGTRRATAAGRLNDGAVAAPPTPAREWALRALAAARAGRTTEAVRCVYRAALKRLEEQGAWRVDDARTPREYAGMLPVGDTRRPLFSDIVRQFEQTFYASRTVTSEDVVRLSHHLETLGCVRSHERAI